MHPIQRHILQELMFHPHRRYSDLKEPEVDSTLFMYHFRKLLALELVAKTEDGYVLTPEGMRHAGKVSTDSLAPRLQPTISTFIGCRDNEGQWLLHTRAYHPFLGLKSFPYGKLHWGENLAEAAIREMEEKTGLKGDLSLWGNIYLKVWEGDELITHMLCHIFKAENITGELKTEGPKGACAWETVGNPEDPAYLPGFASMFALLKREAPTMEIEESVVKMPERYPWPERASSEGFTSLEL